MFVLDKNFRWLRPNQICPPVTQNSNPCKHLHVLMVGCCLDQGCLGRMRVRRTLSWDLPLPPESWDCLWPLLATKESSCFGQCCPCFGFPDAAGLGMSGMGHPSGRHGDLVDSSWHSALVTTTHLQERSRSKGCNSKDCYSRDIITDTFLWVSHRRPDCRPRLVGACQTQNSV